MQRDEMNNISEVGSKLKLILEEKFLIDRNIISNNTYIRDILGPSSKIYIEFTDLIRKEFGINSCIR
jgi:hypothetical protein